MTILPGTNKMWGGRKSHWETYRIRQDSADHDCSLVFFAVIFQKHWCLCRHTVVHLGISGYLHKCIAEARWEMERLIDFTWVHSEKGANLRIRNLGKQSLESCGKQPYWVTFVFLSATEGESGLSLQLFTEKSQIYQATFPKAEMKIWELDKKWNTYIVR